MKRLFICLLVVFRPRENFSISRRQHYQWRAANLYLCSAFMAIEKWRFSVHVPHLLWHEASVFNGHLRGPVTITPIAERLAVELSLQFFTTKVCRGWESNTKPSACGANALTHSATAAVTVYWKEPWIHIHVPYNGWIINNSPKRPINQPIIT